MPIANDSPTLIAVRLRLTSELINQQCDPCLQCTSKHTIAHVIQEDLWPSRSIEKHGPSEDCRETDEVIKLRDV